MEKAVEPALLDLLHKADFRIFNLETPICDSEQPIEKEDSCFRADTDTINGLKKLEPNLNATTF